jgi:FMN phosphatase YigB (HAD superfamily)
MIWVRMYKAIIFDCFGVLIADNFDVAYQQLGGDPDKDREFLTNNFLAYNHGWISGLESSKSVAARLGVPVEVWRKTLGSGEHKDERLVKLILSLRKHYKTAMLSNIGRGGLAKRFRADELEQLFDEVVASGEVGYAKPYPEVYHFTADKLNLDPVECVFIDDRKDYCDGAEYVGMKAILYTNFDQARQELVELLSTHNNK